MSDQSAAESKTRKDDTAAPSCLPKGETLPCNNAQLDLTNDVNNDAKLKTRYFHNPFWQGINFITYVNTLVGIANLVVAFVAYKVASDTSDIKSAVGQLSKLASSNVRQVDINERQLGAFVNQLTLDHPPRLKVVDTIIWPKKGEETDIFDLRPGFALRGHFSLINTGRDKASIQSMWCNVFWTSKPLPMHRSYFDSEANNCGLFGSHPTGMPVAGLLDPKSKASFPFDVPAGAGAIWDFQTITPTNYTAEMKLYVWGGVRYEDRVTENRFYVFARYYDPSKGKFIAETDPEYEGQDSDFEKR